MAAGLAFPHAAQAIQIVRYHRPAGKKKWSSETAYAVTSPTAAPGQPGRPAAIIRGHGMIEDRLHRVRDTDFGEDRSQIPTASAPRVMATLPNRGSPPSARAVTLSASAPVSRGVARWSQARIHGIDQSTGTRVLPAWAHLVHHVTEGDPAAGVAESQ